MDLARLDLGTQWAAAFWFGPRQHLPCVQVCKASTTSLVDPPYELQDQADEDDGLLRVIPQSIAGLCFNSVSFPRQYTVYGRLKYSSPLLASQDMA